MTKPPPEAAATEQNATPTLPPIDPTAPPLIQTGLRAWLRRYRRFLPIPLCLLVVVGFRPHLPWGSPFLDTLTDVLGVCICALGQGIRMWAWGSNATVGKWGVRDRGPYTLMRNPLYTGNYLIVVGLVVIFNNLWVYSLVLTSFAYLYYTIAEVEETRMRRRFSTDYREYRAHEVPRFLPALGNLNKALQTTRPFGWRFAWRKEYESCCGWLAGVVTLEIYEGVLLRGWEQNWPYTRAWFVALGGIGIVSLVLLIRKSLVRT